MAPSPLFLSYISQVLPDLGVERVRQTTFAGLCEQWMGKHMPRLQARSRLEEKLRAAPQEREAAAAVLRRKGSLAFRDDVEAFLRAYSRELTPRNGLRFGGYTLYTAEEVDAILQRQLSPFPLAQRIEELKKYIRRRLAQTVDAMKSALDKMAQDRLTALLSAMPDGPERRAGPRGCSPAGTSVCLRSMRGPSNT